MTARTTEKASPRERLLFAANELFYEEGVHTVGIECGTRPPWLGRAQEEAEEKDMTEISTAGLNHAAFTVSDVERSRAFYSLLGFKEIRPVPNGIITSNGVVILLLRTAPEHATPGDRFDPNRIGLDHFNLSVGSRDDLDRAVSVFVDHNIEHGEITDLPTGIAVLMARDPDNIQIELSAPSE
jgi:catechol 2,3-dioxygenase-like lactoylglutathione lyase family enzyme